MIKPCFKFKSARYTNKDQIVKIGQILDISDLNPVWTKIGHPNFFWLGLGRYRSENLGKMTPLVVTSRGIIDIILLMISFNDGF